MTADYGKKREAFAPKRGQKEKIMTDFSVRDKKNDKFIDKKMKFREKKKKRRKKKI